MAETVLIVDDGADARDSLADVLTLHGYAVERAEDGHEAVELLGHLTPDVILLDVRMPRMNGHEVLAWIRSQPRLASVPIIVMSGTEVAPAGPVGFLAKPAAPEAVLAAVQAAIGP